MRPNLVTRCAAHRSVPCIRRHVVCSQDDVLTIALWIMFAWVHDEVATHTTRVA